MAFGVSEIIQNLTLHPRDEERQSKIIARDKPCLLQFNTFFWEVVLLFFFLLVCEILSPVCPPKIFFKNLHIDIQCFIQHKYRLRGQINILHRQIRIPEAHFGNWKLTIEKYKPYEAFVCDDIRTDEELKEIPQIGFFDTEFSFPAVMEDGQEWMAIKPNEIETMRQPIARAAGQVVAFGLGMGYYAFMVSEKPEVKTLTIVERDENVIALFREHILPQFPKKEKIDIVRQDAFEFATNCMSDGYYDHAFVDLWHDVSDGYPLYKQMKALEKNSPNTLFSYWIEDSLLSHLRWELFHRMSDLLSATAPAGEPVILRPVYTYEQFVACLRNPFLRKLAGTGLL